jgi:PAS domain S-box-containing protein
VPIDTVCEHVASVEGTSDRARGACRGSAAATKSAKAFIVDVDANLGWDDPVGPTAAERPSETVRIDGASADVFLEALLEYSSDAISVGDRESRRFVLVSDSFCTLTGYARRELIGRTSVEVGLIADDAVRAEMLSQTDSGIGSLYELRLCCKDGTTCLVESSVQLLAGEFMLTITRNITKRRDAELEFERQALAHAAVKQHDRDRRLATEASRVSERRFRAMATLAPVGIFESTDDGTVVYVNRRVSEMTGRTRDELEGGLLAAVHPEDRLRVSAACTTDAALTGEVEVEFRLQRPDLSEVLVIARRAAIHDGDGRVTGFLGMLADVTALKDAERVARESESRLQALLDHAPLPMRLRDLDGRYVVINRSCAELIGSTVGEALCRDPQAPYPLHIPNYFDEQERLVREGEGASTIEVTGLDASGRNHEYLATKFPVTDREGRIVAVGGVWLEVTERKRAEEALRAAEERYREMFENSPTGIIESTVDGVPTAVNRAWASLLGYDSPDQFMAEVATTTERYADATDREVVLKAIREHGTVTWFELRLWRRDGATVWIAAEAHAITNADGETVGWHASGVDITERKHVEEALRESEERFRLLADNSRDVIRLYDPDRTIRYASPSCATVLGYTPEELVGHHSSEFQHPDDLAKIDERRRTAVATDDEVTLTYRSRRKGGGYVWLEVNVRTLRDEDSGAVVGYQEAARDITGRKRAEQKFTGLLESAPDAMVIVNETGEIQLANAETEQLFGYRRDELIGQPVEILIPARYRGRHPGHRARFFATPQARAMGEGLELWGRRNDGFEFPVEISLSPLETEDGLLATAAIRDVTQRKRFEQQLQESNTELERANRAKDQFLSSMSHELRTPLNAILGFTGTLLMGLHGPISEDQRTQLRTVRRTGSHLLSLINDMLDLAQIESGKMELHPESVDCRGLVDELVAGLQPLADEKGLALEVHSSPKSVALNCDRRAVSQILINLTNNAIKFTDEGSVRIELAQRSAGARRVTRFAVTDTGRGIAAADQERLFGAFEQIGDDAHRFEGTGLGLSISQSLAALIGGEITVDSVSGEGSTFALELTEATS